MKRADSFAVTILLEMELAFAVLSAAGFLRHLLIAIYPPMVWFVFALFVVFAIAWAMFLIVQVRRKSTAVAH